MKIVLLKKIVKLGEKGEIKDVSEGYARNFLIPKGMAEILTKHTQGILKAQERKHHRLKKEKTIGKLKQIKKINGKKFVVLAKADEKGTLYAGWDKKAIAGELCQQGYQVEIKEIKLLEKIKKVGIYELDLIFSDNKARIKLEIKAAS